MKNIKANDSLYVVMLLMDDGFGEKGPIFSSPAKATIKDL